MKTLLLVAMIALLSPMAQAFQILSPTTTGCHERMLLGTLGRESGGYIGDGLPSTASLLNRFMTRVAQVGVPTDVGTRGVMREMSNRYHWEGKSDVEIFVLASFVAGVRSPDTNGSSIVDFNKIRDTHIRDTEQSAHILRRKGDDEPNGDVAAIAAAPEPNEGYLDKVDATWAGNPIRTERWTFAFRGEHNVSVFAPAFDLGVVAHTIQDGYAHALRDDNMDIIVISNYLEVILEDFHDGRDGARHSDRLDQCNPADSFDLMRITEARKQLATFINDVDVALASSSSSLTATQSTLNDIFSYRAGCTVYDEFCDSEWYKQAKLDFSEPYNIGCGLVASHDHNHLPPPPMNPPSPPTGISLALLLAPLLFLFGLKFRRSPADFARGFAVILILFSAQISFGAEFKDPTGGKPFLPWLWEDQFKPTIKAADNSGNYGILGATVASTVVAHQYDEEFFDDYGDNQKMSSDVTQYGAVIASGPPVIAIALAQLYFDQDNGLMHARSIILTSATHITTAFASHRERPNKSNSLSFPSGHAANAFTSATSLAYAYGPWVGVPAFGVASFIAAARMADNAHWFSDTVAAAGLGIFWARASYLHKSKVDKQRAEAAAVTWTPTLIPGGALVSLGADF